VMCSLYGLELLYSTNFAELTFITILPVQPYDYLKNTKIQVLKTVKYDSAVLHETRWWSSRS